MSFITPEQRSELHNSDTTFSGQASSKHPDDVAPAIAFTEESKPHANAPTVCKPLCLDVSCTGLVPAVAYGASVRLWWAEDKTNPLQVDDETNTIMARYYTFTINEEETAATIPFECPPLNKTGQYIFEVLLYDQDQDSTLKEEDRLLAVMTRTLQAKGCNNICGSRESSQEAQPVLEIASVDSQCLHPAACKEVQRPDYIMDAEHLLAQPLKCDQGPESRHSDCSEATRAPITVLMAGLCALGCHKSASIFWSLGHDFVEFLILGHAVGHALMNSDNLP